MKKEKTVNEGYIRDALKLEMDVPEGVNERIIKAARQSVHRSTRIYKIVPAMAACAAIVLLSGVAVNAATGGELIRRWLKPADSVLYMPENSELEMSEIVWTDRTGEEHKALEISIGNDETGRDAFGSHAHEDDATIEMVIPIGADEKPGERMYVFHAAAYPWGQTELDMYFAIREQFPSDFARVNPDKIDMVIAAMRDMIEKEEREEVRQGVLDAIDDFENGRRVVCLTHIHSRNLEEGEEVSEDERVFTDDAGNRWTIDPESNDWICEDITDIADTHFYMIADSAYGTDKTYICEIQEGNMGSRPYSEEAMEEVNESGLPVYDMRK